MPFPDYLRVVAEKKSSIIFTEKDQRMGQLYYNVLHDFKPEMANDFTGQPFDCFYNDNLIGVFLSNVCMKWDEY